MKKLLIRQFAALGLALLFVAVPSSALQEAPTVRAELDGIVQRLEARTGRNLKLGNEMVEQLRQRTALVGAIPDVIRSGGVSLECSDTLIWGLAEIASTQAQDALTAIHTDGAHRHLDRLRAVMALGGLKSPTANSVSGLWSAAVERSDPETVDLSNTALLSLGAAGSKLKGSPERYAVLTGSLIAGLQAPGAGSARRVAYLRAMGNLHDPELGFLVVEHLYDTSAPVRASAAEAIGMLRDDENRDLLVTLLTTETHGLVRVALTEALRALPADELSLQTVNALARNEPNEEARAQMVQYLTEHLHRFEDARPTLTFLTANDPATRIRILASYVLRH